MKIESVSALKDFMKILRKIMDNEKALLFIREQIDAIDSKLLLYLNQDNLSLQIGKVKKT